MASVTKTRTYASGTPSNLSATNYDADRDEIIAGVNDITNAQINASAAIAATKLSGVVTLAGAESISGVKTHSKAVNITIANTVNDVALEVTQNDVTNNPNAATITNTGTGNGLFINQDGNGVALSIDNAGTSNGLYINQDGEGMALNIDTEGTTTSGTGINVAADVLTSGNALKVSVDSASFTGKVGYFIQDHASGTGEVVSIYNDGTGSGLFIDQNGDGRALNIDSEATTQQAIYYDIPIANDTASFGAYHGASAKFQIIRNDDVNNDVVIALGDRYLWFDTTGDLRTQSANPSSDTGGTVVGSQS